MATLLEENPRPTGGKGRHYEFLVGFRGKKGHFFNMYGHIRLPLSKQGFFD